MSRRVFYGALAGLGGALFVMLAMHYLGRDSLNSSEPKEKLRAELEMREGKWLEKGGGRVFSGVLLDTYPDGKVRSRTVVLNGVLEGLSEGFYTNGVKQVEEHFTAGMSDGLRTKYFPSGRKLSEATVVSGVLDGTYKKWDEGGHLSEQVEMKAGQPEGYALGYYPSGFIRIRVKMDHGKPVSQETWEDGVKPGVSQVAAK